MPSGSQPSWLYSRSGQYSSHTFGPTMRRISPSVIRRCSPSAITMWTSSTPWSASISHTISSTSCRTSGVRMIGSGIEMSSTATVTFIPGRSSACSGGESSGWLSA